MRRCVNDPRWTRSLRAMYKALAGGIGRDRMTGVMSFAAMIARTVCVGCPLRTPRSRYPAIRGAIATQPRPSLRSM